MRKALLISGAAILAAAILLLRWVLITPEVRQGQPRGAEVAGVGEKGEPSPPSGAPEGKSEKDSASASSPPPDTDPRLYEESVLLDDWWLPAYEELAKADARIGTAKALLSQGNYQGVRILMDEIISSLPGTDACALAYLMRGIAFLGERDIESALADFEKVILEYPESVAAVEAVNRFGQCHFGADTILAGMDWVIDVLERDPANTAARKAKWELIVRAARKGQLSDLEELWQICVDGLKAGDEPIEAYEAGLALAKALPRYNRSRMFELFREIAQYCPDPTIAGQAKLELVERYAGSYPDYALRLGNEVLSSSADQGIKKQVKRLMFAAYVAQGDIVMARDMFDEVSSEGWPADSLCYFLSTSMGTALAKGVDKKELLSWMTYLAGREGEVGEHARIWKTLIENPSQPEALEEATFYVLRDLGNAYVAKEQYDLVEQMGIYCLEKAEEDDPVNFGKYMRAVDLIIRAMRARGDPGAAADMLRMSLDRFPDEPEAAEWAVPLGAYLEYAGRLDEAIAEYERVIDQFPHSVAAPRALYVMGDTYQNQLKDPAKAREAYQTLIERYPDSGYVVYAKERLKSLEGSR